MATMRRRLMPPDDYLRGHTFTHESNPQAYPWLIPCETRQAQRMREGPERKDMGLHTREHQEFINRLPPPAAHSLAPRPFVAKAKSRGKRPDIALWPVGCPEPQFIPLTKDEQDFRGAVMNAVRAANAVRGGGPPGTQQGGMRKSASVPGPRARKKAEAAAAASSAQIAAAIRRQKQRMSSEVVDDILPIDSISQAPSVNQDGESLYEDVMSAETMTDSRIHMPLEHRLKKDISKHLDRNRAGWYDWHAGRLLG